MLEVVTLLFLVEAVRSDVKCGNIMCSNLQYCCGESSCCVKSSSAAIGVVIAVVFAVCLVATGVGICLFLKNKVHKDNLYTVDDLESMYARSLKKTVSFGGETELGDPTPTPGPTLFDEEGNPIPVDEEGNPIVKEPTPEPEPEPEPEAEPEPDPESSFPRGLTEKKSKAKSGKGGKGAAPAKKGAKAPVAKAPSKKKKAK